MHTVPWAATMSGRKRPRRRGTGRDERDVDARKRVDRELANLVLGVGEAHRAPDAARRGERHERIDREAPLLEDAGHLPADRAGCADHRDLHVDHPTNGPHTP